MLKNLFNIRNFVQSNQITFKILFRFRLTVKFESLRPISNYKPSQIMPPKKSKRKAETTPNKITPLVKDPFSASKRSKKEENKEDIVQVIEDDKNKLNLEKTPKPVEEEKITDEKVDNENISEDKKSNSRSPSPENNKRKKTSAKSSKAKPAKGKKKDDEDDDDCDDGDDEEKIKEKESKTGTSKTYNKEEFSKPSNGKEYNLKIVSWNIAGIRAWVDKGGMDYLKAEDPDIFCCQEVKCDKSKIPPKAGLPGYHSYWLSGDKPGYSGVGLLTKIKPIKVTYGMSIKKHDTEGRVMVVEYEKFILINTYIPNSGRGLVRLDYRMEWEEEFRKFLANLEKTKPIIWTGDLNVAHNPIDIKNPDSNLKSAGFTVEERACFTKLLSDGYFDSFRYLYPDLTGAYTYWSFFRNARQNNVGWRLDYFVLSEKLKSNLVDNMIRSKVTGSDHCPITLFLKF